MIAGTVHEIKQKMQFVSRMACALLAVSLTLRQGLRRTHVSLTSPNKHPCGSDGEPFIALASEQFSDLPHDRPASMHGNVPTGANGMSEQPKFTARCGLPVWDVAPLSPLAKGLI